jgi:hypothetical protein
MLYNKCVPFGGKTNYHLDDTIIIHPDDNNYVIIQPDNIKFSVPQNFDI